MAKSVIEMGWGNSLAVFDEMFIFAIVRQSQEPQAYSNTNHAPENKFHGGFQKTKNSTSKTFLMALMSLVLINKAVFVVKVTLVKNKQLVHVNFIFAYKEFQILITIQWFTQKMDKNI